MRKLILGTGMGLSIGTLEQIDFIKNAGFDGVFTNWSENESPLVVADKLKELGMIYHSIHAPFGKVHQLWDCKEEGEQETARLIRCLEEAAAAEVDLVIMHASIGMDRHTPTALGVERYARIFDTARRLGIRIALENTEGEEYLEALMNAFSGESHIGFCIDTGHEMCYNECRDMIATYGRRLFSTHLNDNMGKTGEKITWYDDSHLLPFDGVADWEGIVSRLRKVGYVGALTFELTTKGKPERTCSDIYKDLAPEEYLALAYQRACKVRDLFHE